MMNIVFDLRPDQDIIVGFCVCLPSTGHSEFGCTCKINVQENAGGWGRGEGGLREGVIITLN